MKELSTEQRPRVLLCGMQTPENQFSRGLRESGCDVTWVNGDASSNFPNFCEFVVIAKTQCSHQKFWDVKRRYKEMDKPVLIADHSYMTIKEKVESFVKTFREKHPVPKTVVAEALVAAVKNQDDKEAQKLAQLKEMRERRHTKIGKEALFNIVYDGTAAGFSHKDIAAMLTAEKILRPIGGEWKDYDVNNQKQTKGWKEFAAQRDKEKMSQEKPKALPPPLPETKPAPAQDTHKKAEADFLSMALNLNMEPEKKISLLKKFTSGELSAEQLKTFCSVFGDLT